MNLHNHFCLRTVHSHAGAELKESYLPTYLDGICFSTERAIPVCCVCGNYAYAIKYLRDKAWLWHWNRFIIRRGEWERAAVSVDLLLFEQARCLCLFVRWHEFGRNGPIETSGSPACDVTRLKNSAKAACDTQSRSRCAGFRAFN